MNKHQKKESREIKKLMENWWIAEDTKYKTFRRGIRRIKRYFRKEI